MTQSTMLDMLRLLLGLVFLGIASARDLRTRKVPNELWFGMLAIGLIILEGGYFLLGVAPVLLLTPGPVLIIFFLIFMEGELLPEGFSRSVNVGLDGGLLLVAVLTLWFEGKATGYSEDWVRAIHIPLMIFLAYLFYIVRLLHGGADAKALMGLAVLVPSYPVLEGLPLIVDLEPMTLIFPFVFVILLNSAIVTLLVPLGFAFYNLGKGDRSVLMFFGYRLELAKVPDRFVWLMEKVEDGEIVTFIFPKRGGDKKELKKDLKALRKAGVERAWVTPKIPFMVPMFFGFIISFLVGNLVFGLVGWLMGV
jgi:preflagellin peptidase FlaK